MASSSSSVDPSSCLPLGLNLPLNTSSSSSSSSSSSALNKSCNISSSSSSLIKPSLPLLSLSPYTPLATAAFAIAITAMMLLTIIGNILVIIAVLTSRSLKGAQNLFLVSLAAADILVATLIIPFSLANELQGYWAFSALWCEIYLALDVLFCTSSIVHLCAIALDRYLSISKPVSYGAKNRTQTRIKTAIVFVWVFAAIISFPPLLMLNKSEAGDETCELNNEKWYILYSTIGSFFAPCVIMILVYVRIYQIAKKHTRTQKIGQSEKEKVKDEGKDVCAGVGVNNVEDNNEDNGGLVEVPAKLNEQKSGHKVLARVKRIKIFGRLQKRKTSEASQKKSQGVNVSEKSQMDTVDEGTKRIKKFECSQQDENEACKISGQLQNEIKAGEGINLSESLQNQETKNISEPLSGQNGTQGIAIEDSKRERDIFVKGINKNYSDLSQKEDLGSTISFEHKSQTHKDNQGMDSFPEPSQKWDEDPVDNVMMICESLQEGDLFLHDEDDDDQGMTEIKTSGMSQKNTKHNGMQNRIHKISKSFQNHNSESKSVSEPLQRDYEANREGVKMVQMSQGHSENDGITLSAEEEMQIHTQGQSIEASEPFLNVGQGLKMAESLENDDECDNQEGIMTAREREKVLVKMSAFSQQNTHLRESEHGRSMKGIQGVKTFKKSSQNHNENRGIMAANRRETGATKNDISSLDITPYLLQKVPEKSTSFETNTKQKKNLNFPQDSDCVNSNSNIQKSRSLPAMSTKRRRRHDNKPSNSNFFLKENQNHSTLEEKGEGEGSSNSNNFSSGSSSELGMNGEGGGGGGGGGGAFGERLRMNGELFFGDNSSYEKNRGKDYYTQNDKLQFTSSSSSSSEQEVNRAGFQNKAGVKYDGYTRTLTLNQGNSEIMDIVRNGESFRESDEVRKITADRAFTSSSGSEQEVNIGADFHNKAKDENEQNKDNKYAKNFTSNYGSEQEVNRVGFQNKACERYNKDERKMYSSEVEIKSSSQDLRIREKEQNNFTSNRGSEQETDRLTNLQNKAQDANANGQTNRHQNGHHPHPHHHLLLNPHPQQRRHSSKTSKFKGHIRNFSARYRNTLATSFSSSSYSPGTKVALATEETLHLSHTSTQNLSKSNLNLPHAHERVSILNPNHPNFAKTNLQTPISRRKAMANREKRFTFVLAVVMGGFVICWFPFFFSYSLTAVCPESCSIPNPLFKFFFWIGYCNSCLNPVIYTIFNKDFRKAFKRILLKGRFTREM